jgi:peroxiredoxin
MMAACSKGPDVPFPAVDFILDDIFTGDEIHLAGYSGRPVLLYFFASW